MNCEEVHAVSRPRTGFTLVEMMITIAVAAIILAVAVPSFSRSFERQRLRGAAETMLAGVELARSESVKRNQNIRVAFNRTALCYGLRDAATTCACATAGSCTVGGVEMVGTGRDFTGISLTEVNFSNNEFFTLDPVRGMVEPPVEGRICLKSTSGYKANIQISVVGRARICSPSGAANVYNYPVCASDDCPS